MDRREFVTWLAGGGFALACAPAGASPATGPLSPWITIAPDGQITLTTTALEMGQGSRTGQAQVLADELDAPWDRITVVQASESEPFLSDGALYSGGSETLRTRFEILRRAGATARSQLTEAAARRWNVGVETCKAELGEVVHTPSGRRLGYGALAAEAALCAPPKQPMLKPGQARRYIGKPISTIAQPTKLNGEARYGIDFRLPGMAFATIRQCPTFGGTLESVDEGPALAVRGVIKVVKLKDAVAVVAETTFAAFKGAKALQPRWAGPAGAGSAKVSAALEAGIDAPDAVVSPREGGAATRNQLRAAYSGAPRKHEAAYEIAYLSHAPLEPMNATARADATSAEIWAPCQSPTWLREDVVAMTRLAKDKIIVHPLLMGGGFGRRLKGDYGARAVQVAQHLDRPVQVVWTREEDMAHDFYRPAMRMVLRATLGDDGALTGYEVLATTADDRTGGSGAKPYALTSAATLATAKLGIPIGAWRAVDPGMALFAKESFIDECAHLAGANPLAYRDAMLGENPRARRALLTAAQAIGWDAPRARGVGRGLAMLEDWDTIVAHAVEVRVEGGRLRVTRLVAAADVGLAVNPQQVRAQFEGGGLMALSAALGEQMTFTDGRADQANFDTYPILRMRQAPRVDVILLETADVPMGGAGEPPVPGVAPALANAIFQATGKRVRRLPFVTQGFEI
jgi:isoquinoline 1-oxidoreductase beta subunit